MSQTILLVDDSEVVRTFVSVILKPKGYNLLVADGPDAALALVNKATQLDLLIADLNLPELCGTLLFERVSALHPETRSLFISGYTEEEAIERYKPDGFKGDFLGKPFLSQELVNFIERILMRPHGRGNEPFEVSTPPLEGKGLPPMLLPIRLISETGPAAPPYSRTF